MAGCKGFSYVEVIIALAILCIVLLPVFPALIQAQKNNAHAYAYYQAQANARKLLLSVQAALPEAGDTGTIAVDFAADEDEDDFLYRAMVYGGTSTARTAYITEPDDVDNWIWPEADIPGLQTNYPGMMAQSGFFITVEVYADDGRLLAQTVGMVGS